MRFTIDIEYKGKTYQRSVTNDFAIRGPSNHNLYAVGYGLKMHFFRITNDGWVYEGKLLDDETAKAIIKGLENYFLIK